MSLTYRTKKLLEQALADAGAAAEMASVIDTSSTVTIPQALGATATPTFATVTVGTGGLIVGANKVVGARQSAIAANTFTATTGSLPTADGATVFADAAAPTVAELLEAVVELKAKVDALRTALSTHGLTA